MVFAVFAQSYNYTPLANFPQTESSTGLKQQLASKNSNPEVEGEVTSESTPEPSVSLHSKVRISPYSETWSLRVI